ncbi:polysaccharide deacetylase family protein [Veillonella montpellierensis]|uniref:polysaccharide deacetylase family protein n=1 Tax=Veillonella montpellierensis TaxID=187328 RepID=UPI00068D05E8|nr:polysaccharide deacetylase family protein [Veillonella montpellierensis]
MKALQVIIIVIIGIIIGFIGWITYTWTHSYEYYAGGIPVLNYHQVADTGAGVLTLHSEHFRQQMEYLKSEDYHPISLDELEAYLEGRGSLPWKPVVITFDDGYEDNYQVAYPILKEYGFKATIFMIGQDVNRKGFLTAAQLQELQAHGIDIENHTYAHKPLDTFSYDETVADLIHAKAILQDILHKDTKYLAYPQGRYNEEAKRAVHDMGFTRAFTVGPGFATTDSDPMATPRMPIFEGATAWFTNYDLFRIRMHVAQLVEWSWNVRMFAKRHNVPWLYGIMPDI